MAEQRRIAKPAGGARNSNCQLTTKIPVYSTTYSATFGKRVHDPLRVNFKSYYGHPSGTGFTANQRPGLYYRPTLDHIDNPRFGILLSDSFMSLTKRDYQPRIRSDFSGSLPNLNNKLPHSGFCQLRTHTNKASTVEDKSEYQRCFLPHRLTSIVSQNHVIVGPKEDTSYTEGTELQLNTFQEKNRSNVELRQTPRSVMKNDFLPPLPLQDKGAIPALCSHSCRETGFTRDTKAPLACPTSLLPSPHTKSRPLTKKTIGKKEPTGSLLNAPNNQCLPNTPFDISHFKTHYKSRFCDYADVDKLRCGYIGAGILSTKMDTGYNRRGTDRYTNVARSQS
ncbi:stabilizer of axonemal microtubules 4 isoform X1 [Channa argus]|uniref:stabilizer of axonemal microtubules 4 isoform X1 n=1 Tax=Channa argus TaxID=215402 RepID=UPI003521A74B